MSNYFIGAKVIIAIVLIFTGYRFFSQLDNDSIMIHSISVDVADIKASLDGLTSTVASLARNQSEDEHAIANLRNEKIR